MSKYQEFVGFIIKNVGGKDNIESVTHCMTRLRFTLKNDALVNQKNLTDHEEIITAQKSNGQYQVVVGTHVADVYTEVLEQIGGSKASSGETTEKKTPLNQLIDIITKVITPVLGILTTAGLFQGLTVLLQVTGVVTKTDGAYIIIQAIGDALFTFFPIFLGYTSAKAFKMDKFVGMMLGACLVYPSLLPNFTQGDALYTMLQGTIFATPIYNTFFGLPIIFPAYGYGSTVIPIMLAMFFAAKVERFLKERFTGIVGYTIIPFGTLLVGVPLTILLVGPVANVLSQLISSGFTFLYSTAPIIAALVVGLMYQPLVILGLHWPLITIGLNNLGVYGSDTLMPILFTASFCQLAVVAAVLMRTKSERTKAIGMPAIISALFCIIEPAIYGVTLPVKKRFAFSMIGGAIGGAIMAAFTVRRYAAVMGIFGFVTFIDPETGDMSKLIVTIIATIISMAIAFALTYLTFKPEDDLIADGKQATATESTDTILDKLEITAPLSGKTKALSESTDDAFSQGILGKGIIIEPSEGKVFAPFDGTVTAFLPSGHALGLTSDTGIELLIHVGMDTVRLEGKYFDKKVATGDTFKKGDLLLEFDIEKIEAAGYSVETPIIVTNSDQYLDVIDVEDVEIMPGTQANVLTVIVH